MRRPSPTLFQSYEEEHQFFEDALRAEAAAKTPLSILEAGCGQRWFADLAGYETHLTGVDIDEDALRIRMETYNDLDEAISGDLLQVQFPDHSFDVIYCSFVLEHVDDPETLLDRFVRWLRPDGLLLLRIPDRNSVKGFVTRMTPFGLHVLYYRRVRHDPNAGKPGHTPYPTPFRPIVSRTGMRRYCETRGLTMVAERGRSTSVDEHGFLIRSVIRLGGVLTLGALRSDYSDLDFLIRKQDGPMTSAVDGS